MFTQNPPIRLLTLVGAGGTGKTRLSLELGAQVLNEYADGVWLVELANFNDPSLIVQAIANTLNIKEENGVPLIHTLIKELSKRHLLLILDNCEHVIVECAQVVQNLMYNCPQLQILATSREVLAVPGEQVFRVPTLSLPPSIKDRNFLPQETLDFEAVRLFVERARSANSKFIFSEKNASPIVDLCRQLDGIPLAIELAAARTRLLSVEQINSRLHDRFRLLSVTASNRGMQPRQQTLYDLVAWSYNLLSQREQVLFRRLAVFSGGFSMEAAEKVCAGEFELQGGWGVIETDEVLDLMAELVNKSLVLAEEETGSGTGQETEMRYRLLETIHEFARHKLEEAEEVAEIQAKHTDWVIALVEEAELNLRGSAQLEWLNRLELEYSNIRLALKYTTNRHNKQEDEDEEAAEKSYRLTAALWPFWMARSHFLEGKHWFETLKTESGLDLHLRSRVVKGAAIMEEYIASNPERTRALKEENLALQRQLNNPQGITEALLELAWFELHELHYAQALRLSEECLEIAYGLNDKYLVSSVRMLIVSSSLSDFVSSCFPITEDGEVVIQSLTALIEAMLAYGRSDRYQKSLAYLKESLEVWQELEDKSSIGSTLMLLANLDMSAGNYHEAETLFAQSIITYLELGNKYALFAIPWLLSTPILLRPALTHKELKQLTLLLSATQSLFKTLNLAEFPRFILNKEPVKKELVDRLGKAQFEEVWAAGSKVSYEEFIALCRQLIAVAMNSDYANAGGTEVNAINAPQENIKLAPPPLPGPIPGGLSERELEVLKLVAQNYTDAEVAQKLILSPRTVNAHLRSIYSKLDVKSRRDASRFAQQHNLL